MPRYTIREARELLDKVLVAPRQRRWLEADLERVVNRVRVQVGEQAQAVAGELLPRASRPQERSLDLVAGPQDLLKRVQNHRIDLADALTRRAELRRELEDPPSEVRGLIERHEQLRALEDEDPVENAEDFYVRTCRAAWRPRWSGRSSRASRRSVWRSNTAGGGE